MSIRLLGYDEYKIEGRGRKKTLRIGDYILNIWIMKKNERLCINISRIKGESIHEIGTIVVEDK